MKKTLLVCLVLVFGISPAFALTAKERIRVLKVRVHLKEAQRNYDILNRELQSADQRAVDAEGHAKTTDDKAGVLQGEVDRAHNNEKRLAEDNARMLPIYTMVRKWWGIGGIVYGFGRLAQHILILIAFLAVVAIVLSLVTKIPIVGLLRIVGGFFVGVWKRIVAALKPKPKK